jgi:hypothetical protein
MTHPCDGHACDNCTICQAGYCCGSITTEQRAQIEAATNSASDARLRNAIEQECGSQLSIAELVSQDAAQQRTTSRAAGPPLLLPAPTTSPDLTEPRKEAVYVVPPRPTH